jgi:AraC-like DNA-binding protein
MRICARTPDGSFVIPTLARDGMLYWRLQPDRRLRPWIVCYYLVKSDPSSEIAGTSSAIDRNQLLIPDGHSEIVFRFAGGFERWRIDQPAERTLMGTSYAIGGRSHSVMTQSLGGLHLAGVKLHPCALRAVMGMPLFQFRDTTVTLQELGCAALLDLEDAVAGVKSAESLARVLDHFFLGRLSNAELDESMIQALVQRIRFTRGSQSILQWARDYGIDPRTLERRFIAGMGMTPKQYARIVRFKHSYYHLLSGSPSKGRAHLEAYYDQSHFNREFKAFLGTRPGSWSASPINFRTTVGDHLLVGELSGTDES